MMINPHHIIARERAEQHARVGVHIEYRFGRYSPEYKQWSSAHNSLLWEMTSIPLLVDPAVIYPPKGQLKLC